MRRNNLQISDLESAILKRIRACGAISRVELARDLGLAPSTAGIYVERLIAGGFLTESEKATGGAGRPPRLLCTNPEGGEFIGVDFEARNIMAVAVDFSDRPLRHAHRGIDSGTSAEETIEKIEAAVAEVLPEDRSRLLAIGVGVPGLVDLSRGLAVRYKYIANWQNVPLADRLTQRFGVPVFLENNARSMALAELWFGEGRGHSDFICIGIRSGIGVGMVLNGSLYRGAHHGAGEMGRWRCPALSLSATPWFAAQEEKSCGGPELQEVASARSIQDAVKRAIELGRKSILQAPISLPALVRAAQQRDSLTVRVIGEAAGALGTAIGQLALMVDPAKVVLAGPLTLLGETFLEPVRAAVRAALEPSGIEPPQIVNSAMGEYSGALGAAALALHEWKPSGGVAGEAASAKPANAKARRRFRRPRDRP